MPARIPLLSKSPFEIDSRPLEEMASPHAGLLTTSRAFRSLQVGSLTEANLRIKQRERGFSEGQFIESIVLLQTLGGDCPEDVKLLAGDQCLERGLGYVPPKVRAVRNFLESFHDFNQNRPEREIQKSFIFPASQAIDGLQQVQAGVVRRIAKLYAANGQAQTIATIDQDATIIESHKQSALPHYEGGRGYQPMVAVWAEADLVLADEFRDGNVPARQAPLTCARLAFAALPEDIKERYFRGDSACHENQLIQWLNAPERAKEKGGSIGFAMSAMMSEALAREMAKIPDRQWKTLATEADGTLRQCAEVPFVPADPSEHKDSQPLRYVGLRLLKPQGALFADGSDRHHHAVVTNLSWSAERLIKWHREKAGTVEHVHDEIKNALGGGHMPSQHFGANAAWFKLALLSYNIGSAIKGLCLNPEERTARLKKYRLLLVHLAGRMSRFQCKLRLRFRASAETIARVQRVWRVFDLPTQATAFK